MIIEAQRKLGEMPWSEPWETEKGLELILLAE